MSSQPPPHGRRSSTNTVSPLRRKNAASSDQFRSWLQTPELRREAEASRSRVAASSARAASNSTTQPTSSSTTPIARTSSSARPSSARQNTPPANPFTRKNTPPSPPSPACSSLTRSHSPQSTSGSVLTRTPPSPGSTLTRTPPSGSGMMHTPPSPFSPRRDTTAQQRPRGTHGGKPPVQPRTRPAAANTSKNTNQKAQATKKGNGLVKGSSSKSSGMNGAPRKDRDGGSGSGARLTGCSLGAPAVQPQAPVRSRWRNFLKMGHDSGGHVNRSGARRASQNHHAAATIVLNSNMFSVDNVA